MSRREVNMNYLHEERHRLNYETGEEIKLFIVGGVFYVSCGGKIIVAADNYKAAYHAYNVVERGTFE